MRLKGQPGRLALDATTWMTDAVPTRPFCCTFIFLPSCSGRLKSFDFWLGICYVLRSSTSATCPGQNKGVMMCVGCQQEAMTYISNDERAFAAAFGQLRSVTRQSIHRICGENADMMYVQVCHNVATFASAVLGLRSSGLQSARSASIRAKQCRELASVTTITIVGHLVRPP